MIDAQTDILLAYWTYLLGALLNAAMVLAFIILVFSQMIREEIQKWKDSQK